MSRKGFGISLAIIWLLMFGMQFAELMAFSINSKVYTHIIFVPVVSAYLLWLNRERISADQRVSWPIEATVLIVIGILGLAMRLSIGPFKDEADSLFLSTFSGVFVFWGMFLGNFGGRVFKTLLFPLLFLMFMVPLPSMVLDGLVRFLQVASADVAAVVFRILHITAYHQGTEFMLPGMSIEVAPECSGIRSCFALIVLSLVASYLFLRSHWRRATFMAVVVPVAVFKNALRIVLLAYLGSYVNEEFITDSLIHSAGGKPFLVLGALILLPLLWGLLINERTARKAGKMSDKVLPSANSVSVI